MKMNKNIVMLILLIGFMLLEPIPNKLIYNTILGRVVILGMVVFFTVNHTVLGLLATVILLASLQISAKRQGFKNKVSKNLVITGGDRTSMEDSIRYSNTFYPGCKKNLPNITPFNSDTY